MFNLATLFLVGNVLGSFASGWITASIGKKMAIFSSGFPLALSWLVMGLSINSVMLYASSFFQGMFTTIQWNSVGKFMDFLKCVQIKIFTRSFVSTIHKIIVSTLQFLTLMCRCLHI